eukprot:scaffold13930_cov131-Isochrysis_galbana.AAC.2
MKNEKKEAKGGRKERRGVNAAEAKRVKAVYLPYPYTVNTTVGMCATRNAMCDVIKEQMV